MCTRVPVHAKGPKIPIVRLIPIGKGEKVTCDGAKYYSDV